MQHRLTTVARWVSLACFGLSAVLLVTALPFDAILEALQGWIEGLGVFAPLAYAALYGVASTLLVPGSALSLAAGVLFGVWIGTLVVWAGASIAIALSFLIARYLARARVEALAATRPRFAAVDKAIGEQGWKIVALMRLSPVFPFGLQNYLFGVTAIRFWPCFVASVTFILPGTFLYVYLGFAGGAAAAAVGGSGSTDALKLGLQVVGLLATLGVTVYIARTAARAIAKHAPEAASVGEPVQAAPATAPSLGRAVLTLVLAGACLLGAGYMYVQKDAVRSLLSDAGSAAAEPLAGQRCPASGCGVRRA